MKTFEVGLRWVQNRRKHIYFQMANDEAHSAHSLSLNTFFPIFTFFCTSQCHSTLFLLTTDYASCFLIVACSRSVRIEAAQAVYQNLSRLSRLAKCLLGASNKHENGHCQGVLQYVTRPEVTLRSRNRITGCTLTAYFLTEKQSF